MFASPRAFSVQDVLSLRRPRPRRFPLQSGRKLSWEELSILLGGANVSFMEYTSLFFWVEAAESAHQESADAAESSAHQESADAAESAQETDMDSCVGPGCPSRHHVELEVINRVSEETMVA